MSLLKRLFGGGDGERPARAEKVVAHETYKGFSIAATPVAEGGQFRLAATITKEADGAGKSHRLVRADTFTSEDDAASAAIAKAKKVIDEQGERLLEN